MGKETILHFNLKKAGEEELNNEYHISFLQKLGGIKTVRKSKTITLSLFPSEAQNNHSFNK